jgi:hypothetical protein
MLANCWIATLGSGAQNGKSPSMINAKAGMVLAAAVWLSACATRPAAEVWSGGDVSHLAADQASCRSEAASLDVNDPSNYSDPRYGVTSAMAEAVARDNPLADRGAIERRAAYETCMNDKGWRLPQ